MPFPVRFDSEGTGYYDWRELDGGASSLESGRGFFDVPNKDPDSRSYVSEGFTYFKIFCGGHQTPSHKPYTLKSALEILLCQR